MQGLFGATVFDYPKPVRYIRRMIEMAGASGHDDEESITLDFFGGSGTTAHAVMEQNNEDSGNRQFILVQLPEPLEKPVELTGGKHLRTIADITRERVRRAAAKLNADGQGTLTEDGAKPDRGFRAFRLASSHFQPWDDDPNADAEALAAKLRAHTQGVLDQADPEGILFEILLKSRFPLSVPVTSVKMGGQEVKSVDGGKLLVNLSMKLTDASLRAMIAETPAQIVVLDDGFAGNDSLKANIAQQVKQHNALHPDHPIDFRTV